MSARYISYSFEPRVLALNPKHSKIMASMYEEAVTNFCGRPAGADKGMTRVEKRVLMHDEV